MYLTKAILTGHTCGESCWRADEDICRCSCGGKNHGCLREKNGVRPTRTSRIDGNMYELKAVGDEVHDQAVAINEAAGVDFLYADTSRERMYRNIPAKTRKASASQVAKWPELAAWRDRDQYYAPYLLWVRVN